MGLKKTMLMGGVLAATMIAGGAESRAGIQSPASPQSDALRAGYALLGSTNATPNRGAHAAGPAVLAWPAVMPLAYVNRAVDALLPHSFTISVAGLGGLCMLTAKRGSLRPTHKPALPAGPKPADSLPTAGLTTA